MGFLSVFGVLITFPRYQCNVSRFSEWEIRGDDWSGEGCISERENETEYIAMEYRVLGGGILRILLTNVTLIYHEITCM
jgi:hypothetical protein